VTKEEQVGNNSLNKYKAVPSRYLGIDPKNPANYLIYDILRKRVITRSTCKFEENFTRKTVEYYENQLKIANTDKEFLELHRNECNDIEEELNVQLLERRQDDNTIDDDDILPTVTDVDNESDEGEDDGESEPEYWDEPEDNSIIPTCTDWQKETDDAEGSTSSEDKNSDKSYICMICSDECPRTNVPGQMSPDKCPRTISPDNVPGQMSPDNVLGQCPRTNCQRPQDKNMY
jgi:hypothetical protein